MTPDKLADYLRHMQEGAHQVADLNPCRDR
jgi:hypothetical protein